MALQLDFNLCVTNNCGNIQFTETTGYYNDSNITGYGTPNIDTSDALTAVLTVTDPDGVVYTINLFTTGLFPSNDVNLDYTLPSSSIGNLTNIVDGKWTFTYTITTVDDTYIRTIYKYFYCNSQCYVDRLLMNIEDCDCCADNKSMDNYRKAWTYLEMLKNAAKCGDLSNFTKIKKILDKLCLNSNCKTCK